MQGIYLRKYGVEAIIDFDLYTTTGSELKTDAVHAAGDTKIMKDEGNEANTSNGFVDEGQTYSITLTATEMQAARIKVPIVDQGTKTWLDTTLMIETCGHASAQHAFDLDTATVAVSPKTGFKLASDGLNSVSIVEPAGVASNFREMLVQTWRRWFIKTELDEEAGTLKTYKDNDTVCTTQTVEETGGVQTVEDAS